MLIKKKTTLHVLGILIDHRGIILPRYRIGKYTVMIAVFCEINK